MTAVTILSHQMYSIVRASRICATQKSDTYYTTITNDAKSTVNANTHGNAKPPMNYTFYSNFYANARITITYYFIEPHRNRNRIARHIILFSTVLFTHCQKTNETNKEIR